MPLQGPLDGHPNAQPNSPKLEKVISINNVNGRYFVDVTAEPFRSVKVYQ